jgi:hypothetical protein
MWAFVVVIVELAAATVLRGGGPFLDELVGFALRSTLTLPLLGMLLFCRSDTGPASFFVNTPTQTRRPVSPSLSVGLRSSKRGGSVGLPDMLL